MYDETTNCLKALAHPLRLLIIDSLKDGPLCVSEIENVTGSSQSNISQHLALLRKCNILETYREKNNIYYRVENWRIFQFVDRAKELFHA
ncbi:MAG: ArsR/SmtB family transcription factor [Vulcanimicrobiota bacterium]